MKEERILSYLSSKKVDMTQLEKISGGENLAGSTGCQLTYYSGQNDYTCDAN